MFVILLAAPQFFLNIEFFCILFESRVPAKSENREGESVEGVEFQPEIVIYIVRDKFRTSTFLIEGEANGP